MSTTLRQIRERLARHELLRSAPDDETVAALPVLDVTTDSRQVRPGTLFCAVRGTSGDGHQFLAQAAAAGAVAALVEADDRAVDLPQLCVTDGRLAAARAAAEHFRDPWSDLVLVGITGTNGKTTTAAILRHMLAKRGPAASMGTLGVIGADGATVPGTEGLTTPGPVEAARWLRQLADEQIRSVAIEVSSHALDQARVAAVRFDAAVFTNLTQDHLDYHGTLEQYREAKLRLLHLRKPGAAAVVNADDPPWRDLGQDAGRVVRFGVAAEADVRAEAVALIDAGTEWMLRTPTGSARARVPLYGSYNVANALGAAAALWSLGWPAAEIAQALADLPQVPGRLERVPTPKSYPAVLLDYAHTPDALERALQALRPLVAGRLIVLFGAGGDRDRDKRPQMGRAAAHGADLSIVTSDNPRTENPLRILDEIEAGMGGATRLRIADRREAIRRALREARPEDVVLLAGKGHETYQICGTERLPFDERAIVRELVAEQGAKA